MSEGIVIMKTPDLIILYVRDVPASLALYAALLRTQPVESTPGFALLPFREGVMLGLWQANAVKPVPSCVPGGFELCLHEPDEESLLARYGEWRALPGVETEEEPIRREFGFGVVLRDPDGNRLRLLVSAQQEATA